MRLKPQSMLSSKDFSREKDLLATSTVYSYYFPEVRQVIDRVVRCYPHHIFLRSVKPGLDNFHIPIIAKYVRYFRKILGGIDGFKYRYVASGASEPIFHLLARLKIHETGAKIYVLRGEYHGYKEYGKELKIVIHEVSQEQATSVNLPKGIFFISNPSARDGMIISNDLIRQILRRHRIILDASYVGLTRPFRMDLRHKNIIAVVSSLSKPFGLYYYRIGFAFSRAPLPTLEVNKWFKNIFSLVVADAVLSSIKPWLLYRRYAPLQKKAIGHLNRVYSLCLRPADVLILGTAHEEDVRTWNKEAKRLLKPYLRGDVYRLCLTPYFLKFERDPATKFRK